MIYTDLNIDLSTQNFESVKAKQSDLGSRFLRISLENEGQEYIIPENAFITLNARKPDGTVTFTQGQVVENKIEVELTNQTLALAGRVPCDVSVFVDDKKLTSFTFRLDIERTVTSEEVIISTDEFSALTSALSEVGTNINEVEELISQVGDLTEDVTELALEVEQYAGESQGYASDSKEYSIDSEAYALGTRNGAAVDETDLTYQKNSKYYAEKAELVVDGKAEKPPTSTPDNIAVLTADGNLADGGAKIEEIKHEQADYNQSDNTQKDYIKNRPFSSKIVNGDIDEWYLNDGIFIPDDTLFNKIIPTETYEFNILSSSTSYYAQFSLTYGLNDTYSAEIGDYTIFINREGIYAEAEWEWGDGLYFFIRGNHNVVEKQIDPKFIPNYHAHSNKLSLDKITDGDVNNIKTIPDKADKLKVTALEKELSDYKKTLSLVNINQEAKQTAEDTVITLPKNAASGQTKAGLIGKTLKSELNYNRNTWAEWTKSSGVTGNSTGLEYTAVTTANASLPTQFKTSTKYGFLYNIVSNTLDGHFGFDGVFSWKILSTNIGNNKRILTSASTISNNRCHLYIHTSADPQGKIKIKDIRCFELPIGSQIESDFNLLSADELAIKYPYIQGTSSVKGAFRLRSTDGTQASQMYFPNHTIRSSGNVRDELTQDTFIKRISDTGEVLAEPIVAPIQTSGTLLSYPNGTVISEGAVADAGMYKYEWDIESGGYRGIYILNHDLPIKTLEKIVKINYETGIETEIPVGNAIIFSDKLSFTHPALSRGDIVFFTYFHDVESIPPIINIEYYDSRYTIKDTTNDKFYQWNITATGGVPSITLTEV